jgi:hypothetical protein
MKSATLRIRVPAISVGTLITTNGMQGSVGYATSSSFAESYGQNWKTLLVHLQTEENKRYLRTTMNQQYLEFLLDKLGEGL